MNILVCAPMEQEAKNFKQALLNYSLSYALMHHYDVTNIGVGKVSAASEVAVALANPNIKYSYDLILIIGYAAASRDFELGQVVMPKYARCYDVPNSQYGTLFEHMNRVYELCGSDDCTILTGDMFVDAALAELLEKDFSNKIMFDMESAAICQVAYDTDIPVFVMKMVSDIPLSEGHTIETFNNFVKDNSNFLPFVMYVEQLLESDQANTF